MQRRGLRKVVSSVKVDGRTVLTLECGHTVSRAGKQGRHTRPTALCSECRRSDGAKRDKLKTDRDEAAE